MGRTLIGQLKPEIAKSQIGLSGMRPADWRVSLTDLVQADPRV